MEVSLNRTNQLVPLRREDVGSKKLTNVAAGMPIGQQEATVEQTVEASASVDAAPALRRIPGRRGAAVDMWFCS